MNKDSSFLKEHIEDCRNGKKGSYISCQKCKKNQASTNCASLYCGDCCKDEMYDLFCPKHHLRRPLKINKNIKYSTKLKKLPPWLKYPSIPRYDIWWRMGNSEDYWYSFWKEFRELSVQERRWYQQDFPEPEPWKNVYLDMTREYSESEKSNSVYMKLMGH